MLTTSAPSPSSATLSERLFGEEATTSPVSVLELFSSLGAASPISSFGAATGLSAGDVLAITFFSPVAVLPTGFLGGALWVDGAPEALGPPGAAEPEGLLETPSEPESEGAASGPVDRAGIRRLLEGGGVVDEDGADGVHDGSETWAGGRVETIGLGGVHESGTPGGVDEEVEPGSSVAVLQTVPEGGAGGKHCMDAGGGDRLTTFVAFMYPSSKMKSTATSSPRHGRRLGTNFVRQPTLTSAH